MPSKFPCLGQKKLEYSATSPCSNGFLQSFIKLRSHRCALGRRASSGGVAGNFCSLKSISLGFRHSFSDLKLRMTAVID